MDIITGVAIEGSTLYLLGRVNGGDGYAIQQADLTSVTLERFKINPPAERQQGGWQLRFLETHPPERFGDEETLTIADVVFDALVDNDPRWSLDADGYNFRFALGPDAFDVIALADYPKSQWYRVEVKFTPAAVGETAFIAPFVIEVQSSLYGKGSP